MRTLCLLLLAGLWPMLPTAVAAPASTSVTNLRCEFRTEPLGVDSPAPRLFWMLESAARGQRQTAYQVLAASSKELLARDSGDLWDSGKVMSDASAHVPYGGKAPASSQQLFWKVRVWDKDGQATGWSAAASWTMGLLNDADWKGRWIGANPAKAATRKSIGYHAGETPREDDLKWVQVDLGRSTPLQAIRLQPMDHAGKKGFGFPVRFKVELSEDPDFQKPISIADHAEADYPNPGVQPVAFDVKEASARYVRVTVTKIWNRDTSYCFALCQLEAIDKAGTNIAIGAPVTCKDTVEAHGWGKDGLTDGLCGGEPREPDPQTLILRREFVVKPGLRRAVAHVCGLGYYEFSVNGAKAGDALFPPGWTKYDKTCLYDTYDVTGMLRDGPNAVGLLLGNGMYNVVGGRYIKFKGSFGPLKAIGQIQLDYLDGSTEIVGTDDRWTLTPGPITFSCIYGGEDYDARREAHGWN
ncbi:MAG TPA: alpha-L-rhamnosidase N-terminal domain-containing protein, partial [Clostridia bacterium]|nr:alpha-L-rhamnosidase N-terminal domain-containing protein [Clostridia bacterium]